MPVSKYPEKSFFVDLEEARLHASMAIVKHSTTGAPGFAPMLKSYVRSASTAIYDINGEKLFNDYAVGSLGYVRTAASKVLGSPVFSIEMGERSWNFRSACVKLGPVVKKQFPNARISAPKLVCYSYPKLGVMYTVNNGGKTERAIYDVASLDKIPEKTADGKTEGAFAWSFYESLGDAARKKNLTRFEQVEKVSLGHTPQFRKQLLSVKKLDTVAKGIIAPMNIKITLSKLLGFCSHYASTESRSHHCFSLHGQQKNDYCAVATAQMVLDYYRYYYTQDQIAPSLGYHAGGGCPSDQSAGYESLSNNHIDATFDTAPTWEKAKAQIDALHPMKSGIQGHARACAGYSSVITLFPHSVTDKKLYIYDPWPWNASYKLGGTVKWEDWDAITHTNFVFTKLRM